MTDNELYIQAAIAKWGGDADISIDTNPATVDRSPANGAWVTAMLWVEDDELEPEAGPTYDVWSYPSSPDTTCREHWTWVAQFTCSDDPDGKSARAMAHQHACSMRRENPGFLFAVRPAGSRPLIPKGNF